MNRLTPVFEPFKAGEKFSGTEWHHTPKDLGQRFDVEAGKPFTMCARVRVPGPNKKQGGRILSKRDDCMGLGWEFVAPRYNGWISFFGNRRHFNIGRTRLDDGREHHVAVVYENKQMTAYLDGEPDGNPVHIGTVKPSSCATLTAGAQGPQQGHRDRFLGEFWDVSVFGRAASPTEMRMLADGTQHLAIPGSLDAKFVQGVARPEAPGHFPGVPVVQGGEQMTLIEQVELIKRELGVSGAIHEVVHQAAEQLGVPAKGKPLVTLAKDCMLVLGLR